MGRKFAKTLQENQKHGKHQYYISLFLVLLKVSIISVIAFQRIAQNCQLALCLSHLSILLHSSRFLVMQQVRCINRNEQLYLMYCLVHHENHVQYENEVSHDSKIIFTYFQIRAFGQQKCCLVAGRTLLQIVGCSCDYRTRHTFSCVVGEIC